MREEAEIPELAGIGQGGVGEAPVPGASEPELSGRQISFSCMLSDLKGGSLPIDHRVTREVLASVCGGDTDSPIVSRVSHLRQGLPQEIQAAAKDGKLVYQTARGGFLIIPKDKIL